ncbi:MAG TPA: hypothetical protein V6D26_17005, partial [Stenomitos sp.]
MGTKGHKGATANGSYFYVEEDNNTGVYSEDFIPIGLEFDTYSFLAPPLTSYALLASFLTIEKAQVVRLLNQALDSSSQTGVGGERSVEVLQRNST